MLGVSHDGLIYNGEEHSIFVLGLDAEDLREVVRFSDATAFQRTAVSYVGASLSHSSPVSRKGREVG